MPKVFLSYAREDLALAKKVCDDLIAQGVQVWMDENDLLVGQNWRNEITRAIRESDYFMALLSSNSLSKRGFVQKEMKMAVDILEEYPPDQIFILPVRLDECEVMNESLRYLQWADLFPEYEDGMRKVLRVLAPDGGGSPLPTDETGPINEETNQGREPLENKKPDVKYPRRSEPIEVSQDEFKQVFKLNDDRRPLEYVTNNYQDNGDGTITDHATGLMLQQSGSSENLNYKNAKAYFEKLNHDKFAGHNDWRLPTIDELTSLLEPEERNHYLYIDSIFDQRQWGCWSSDMLKGSSGLAWVVFFDCGNVDYYFLLNGNYCCVRVVRAGQ